MKSNIFKVLFLINILLNKKNLNEILINFRNDIGISSFGQLKTTDRIEGIELLRKHENLPEGIFKKFN